MANVKDDFKIQMPNTDQEGILSTNSQLGSSSLRSSEHDTRMRRVRSLPSNPKLPSTDSKTGNKSITSTRSQSASPRPNINFSKLLDVCNLKSNVLIFIEFTAFVFIMVFLIASLKSERLKHSTIWSLNLWKWCLLLLAVVCGRLIAVLCVSIQLCLVWAFWLDEKVLYFVYGVKRSFQFFIWTGLVFLTWGLLFARHGGGVYRTDDTKTTIRYITKALGGCLIGAAIWLLKTLLVKLVGSFHATKLFSKIKEAITNRKILITLSNSKRGDSAKDEPDKEWKIMKELIDGIRVKKLFSLTCTIKDQEGDPVIADEFQARIAGDKIFENLADPDDKGYMEMSIFKQIVHDDKVLKHFKEVEEDKGIEKSVFRQWVVKVYKDHVSLNDTLIYSKSAIDELNMVASGIVLIVNIIVLLLLLEVLTNKALVFVSSQLLLVAFMFGNTAKTVFEAIIFVFLMHPYDVGDRCVIDGVQMVVDEMSILKTIFLKYDGEKIYYPNSVLSAKPISNLYRSPPMSDSLEFAIDISTPNETLHELEKQVKEYLEKNRGRWRPDFSMQFKEIEDVNKLKMVLYVNHTVNFHYVDKRGSRRSELVLHMKNIFEDLKIKYRLLPQEIQLNYVPVRSLSMPASSTTMATLVGAAIQEDPKHK